MNFLCDMNSSFTNETQIDNSPFSRQWLILYLHTTFL